MAHKFKLTTFIASVAFGLSAHSAIAQQNGFSLISSDVQFASVDPLFGLIIPRNLSFAAPLPRAPEKRIDLSGVTPIAQLRSIIASAEAGQMGYDAVQHGARIKPVQHPTDMTVAEIYSWIRATPNQQHAIGRYQFIPATLRSLMKRGGIDPQTRFSPALQDQLTDLLLLDAGYHAFSCGRMTRHRFMNRMARIWAGLPTSSGESAYAGVAGNAATISWANYESAMVKTFPAHLISANARKAACA